MILISPFAKPLRNGGEHPKNYPYWTELLSKIKEPVIQVGMDGEQQLVPDFRKGMSLPELKKLVLECKAWISVDSFFQHFCWDIGKKGIVLFGTSDPFIFGHKENINLLKSRYYLRKNQFLYWENQEINKEAFVSPDVVISELVKLQNGNSL
mgnify:FL=1